MRTDPSDNSIVSLRDVSRRYGAMVAVDQANFTLRAGKTTCLLGPSGSGKSTILRMIAGLEGVDEGVIEIAGEAMSAPGITTPSEKRGVGLVFQDNALFPHLDVTANIGFGLRDLPSKERSERVSRLLEQFHIQHLAKSWPHMLSGGEQQRVAIARALAREPALLLLDEPFSGLDGVLRESVREAVLQDLRRVGATVLIVTHDPAEALSIADDLILMDGGRILQTGSPPQCYHHPASITAARLLGDLLLFDGEIREGRFQTILGLHDATGMADGPAQLGIRPEGLRLDENGTSATVDQVRFAGQFYRLTLTVDGVTVRLNTAIDGLREGQKVSLAYDAKAAQIYR